MPSIYLYDTQVFLVNMDIHTILHIIIYASIFTWLYHFDLLCIYLDMY